MEDSRSKRKKYWIVGGVIGILIMIGVAVLLLEYRRYAEKTGENIEMLNHLVEQVTIETTEATDPVQKVSAETESVGRPKPQHDFVALKEINPDVYAWITIPQTQVDYPVLQSEIDNKYLDTNIDGTSGYPGCIYSNVCNSKDFDDYITVLYGHNMKTGEMFGSLHNFDDADFFKEFETYTVETEDAGFVYRVYAAVNYNDKLIPAHFDVKSTSGRDAFLESLEKCRGNTITYFHDEIEFEEDDKVLVLSVCIKGQDTRRYLIVSKLEDIILYKEKP